MTEQVKKILSELYELEPELRNKETEIVQIIEEMIALKPDTQFDQHFAETLKKRVLMKKASDDLASVPARKKKLFNIFSMPIAAALLVLVAVLAIWPKIKDNNIAKEEGKKTENNIVQIQDPENKLIKNKQALKLATFANDEEFKKYVEDSRSLSGYYGGRGGGSSDAATLMQPTQEKQTFALDSSLPAANIAQGTGGRYSETNVQVQGIDEPDIVKTDGKNIFYSGIYPVYFRDLGMPVPSLPVEKVSPDYFVPPYPNYNSVSRIISALPADKMAVVGKIEQTGEMLLFGDVLVIFSSDNAVHAFDISDKEKPKSLWNIKLLNSARVATRAYAGKLYLVFQEYSDLQKPCPVAPFMLKDAKVEISCAQIYHPEIILPDANVYSVFVIDPKNGEIASKTAFVGSGFGTTAYMSADNLYLTYAFQPDMLTLYLDFLNGNGARIFPKSIVEKIEKLNLYDIGQEAKMTELQQIVEKYLRTLSSDDRRKFENDLSNSMMDYLKNNLRSLSLTGITKIGLKDLKVKATGSIPGNLLNQFSIDEFEGNLRVATTVGGNGFYLGVWQQAENANDVYVLDGNLKKIGEVKNLGKNERIYSARFIGDRGYLVTFRQTDPFYVLDLANAKKPEVKGELKIPGYSSYLHPLRENLILGVGQENGKVKLSLFDVKDAANPKEVDKYLLDEYYSEAQNNHHAFLQDSKHGVFFLPGGNSAYIFSYEEAKLSLKKAISKVTAKRALYIGDMLYILGDNQIISVNEKTWERVGELDF